MPGGRGAPARLTPAATIEVDDSEDARLVGTGAPELLGAVEAYRAKHSQAALSRFFEVLRDPLRPPLPKQLAEIYAAKTLLDLELPHASWMLLDGIATQKHHALRLNALPWLGMLASEIDTDAVLESMQSYEPSERDALTQQKKPLLERLAYLFGRRAFLAGDGDGAATLLEQVSSDAVDYPKALFMLGVLDVRAKRTDAALETFDAVTQALVRPGLDEPERIRGMATMARARVLYQLGEETPNKLDEALAIYRQAKDLEDVGEDARVEEVWTLFKLGRLDEASKALEAAKPMLTTRHAESDELEVMLHLERCSLADAETALKRARERHEEILAQIDEVLKGEVATHVPLAIALGARGRQPRTPLERVIAVAAGRTRLARILRRFAAIREEAKRADALPLDFRESAAGKKVRSLVDAAIARTQAQVGEHLTAELGELKEITSGYLKGMGKLEGELERRKKEGCQ